MSNGKGSAPRPFSVNQETFANNWENIFGKKKEDCAYSGLPSVTSYDQLEKENVSSKGNQ